MVALFPKMHIEEELESHVYFGARGLFQLSAKGGVAVFQSAEVFRVLQRASVHIDFRKAGKVRAN